MQEVCVRTEKETQLAILSIITFPKTQKMKYLPPSPCASAKKRAEAFPPPKKKTAPRSSARVLNVSSSLFYPS